MNWYHNILVEDKFTNAFRWLVLVATINILAWVVFAF